MGRTLSKLAMELLYAFDTAPDDGADPDQVMHYMAWIAEATGELDDAERAEFVATGRELAAETQAAGDAERAEAYGRMADMAEAG